MNESPREILARFAERTGLRGQAPHRRYLWTDAFAVCTFLGLEQRDLAVSLVQSVHRELAHHRSDGAQRGWISGLTELEGDVHPTIGGLRIGKRLPERPAGEPIDEHAEWDRDGQYFHYLTKWMHALDQVARVTHDATHLRWARELADIAHRRFVYTQRATVRMYWKLSIDLSRPLVASMGHHDPLDGYVTCLQLDATARLLDTAPMPGLDDARADYERMLAPASLATGDPLGIGGLLVDAYRLLQLGREPELQAALLAAARRGIAHYIEQPDLRLSANHRLAFRELGLAIGIAAAGAMNAPGFTALLPLRKAINDYWQAPEHRATRTYREHEDINDVMLATSLAPTGYLVLGR